MYHLNTGWKEIKKKASYAETVRNRSSLDSTARFILDLSRFILDNTARIENNERQTALSQETENNALYRTIKRLHARHHHLLPGSS